MMLKQNISSYLLVVLMPIILISCKSSKHEALSFVKNPPFIVENAYFQKWVAGVKGGGSGFRLYIQANSVLEGLVFEKVYFRNKIAKITMAPHNKNTIIASFNTQVNRDIIMDVDIKKEAENTLPEPFPFQLEEKEAVLSYSLQGKLYYYKILNIEEKQMIAYPSRNPNTKNR